VQSGTRAPAKIDVLRMLPGVCGGCRFNLSAGNETL
jgi:hypothetical protein